MILGAIAFDREIGASQGMVRMHDACEAIAYQKALAKMLGGMPVDRDHHVQPADLEIPRAIVLRERQGGQTQVRSLRPATCVEGRKQPLQDLVVGHDPEGPRELPRFFRGYSVQTLEICDNLRDAGMKCHCPRCRLHSVGRLDEERIVEALTQVGKLFAYRRLGQPQRVRGFDHSARVVECAERLKLRGHTRFPFSFTMDEWHSILEMQSAV